jgi:hypothetical protein
VRVHVGSAVRVEGGVGVGVAVVAVVGAAAAAAHMPALQGRVLVVCVLVCTVRASALRPHVRHVRRPRLHQTVSTARASSSAHALVWHSLLLMLRINPINATCTRIVCSHAHIWGVHAGIASPELGWGALHIGHQARAARAHVHVCVWKYGRHDGSVGVEVDVRRYTSACWQRFS